MRKFYSLKTLKCGNCGTPTRPRITERVVESYQRDTPPVKQQVAHYICGRCGIKFDSGIVMND